MMKLAKFCWVKEDTPCGCCLGCYVGWIQNDPVCSGYWERRTAPRATTRTNQLEARDR
jgi:hypothetical protein